MDWATLGEAVIDDTATSRKQNGIGGWRDMTTGLRHDLVHLDSGPSSLFFFCSLSLSLFFFFLEQKMVKRMWGRWGAANSNAGARIALRFNPFCLPAFPVTLSFFGHEPRYIWTAGGKLDYANHLDYADTLEWRDRDKTDVRSNEWCYFILSISSLLLSALFCFFTLSFGSKANGRRRGTEKGGGSRGTFLLCVYTCLNRSANSATASCTIKSAEYYQSNGGQRPQLLINPLCVVKAFWWDRCKMQAIYVIVMCNISGCVLISEFLLEGGVCVLRLSG